MASCHKCGRLKIRKNAEGLRSCRRCGPIRKPDFLSLANSPKLSREALEAELMILARAMTVFSDCYEADFPKSGYPHSMRNMAQNAVEKAGLNLSQYERVA